MSATAGATGEEVARRMLDSEGASAVGITLVPGHLTDHYNPRDNSLHLSEENHSGSSVASVAVACHEAGHAIQTARGYLPYRLRSALVPVVNFAQQTRRFGFRVFEMSPRRGEMSRGELVFVAFTSLSALGAWLSRGVLL